MSFWNDQETQALAQSLGAVIVLDKMAQDSLRPRRRDARQPPATSEKLGLISGNIAA
jgi:hypothetical protein